MAPIATHDADANDHTETSSTMIKQRPLSLVVLEARHIARWNERHRLSGKIGAASTTIDHTIAQADIDLKTLDEKHKELTKTWQESPTYKTLDAIFNEILLKQQTLKINSCMCLCLGSLTADFHDSDREPLSQLVAFESWIELLKTKHSIEHVYLQDPVFNATDITFLKSKGYSIINSPESDDYVSSTTFLFVPFGPPPPITGAIGAAQPLLYIGSDLMMHLGNEVYVKDEDLRIPLGDIPSEKLIEHAIANPMEREMLSSYLRQRDVVGMPKSAELWLQGLWIYYRPDDLTKLKRIVSFDIEEDQLKTEAEVDAWRKEEELRSGRPIHDVM